MTTADDPLAGLRSEIRRAGRNTRRWRLGVGFLALLPAALSAAAVVIILCPGSRVIAYVTYAGRHGRPTEVPLATAA